MVPILLFHAFGCAYNGYLIWLLSGCWSTSSFNKLIAVQIVLNLSNIFSHAVSEVLNSHRAQVLSTAFTALTVYTLAVLLLIRCTTTLRYRRRLSTLTTTCIVLAVLLLSLWFIHLFGRRFEMCDYVNCFSLHLAKTDDRQAVLIHILVQFLLPSVIQLSGSAVMVVRLYRYNKTKIAVASSEESQSFRYLYSSSAALFFMLTCGEVFVQVFRRYSTFGLNSLEELEDLCRISCLYDELYCIMSMFPIFIRCMIIEENRKPDPC